MDDYFVSTKIIMTPFLYLQTAGNLQNDHRHVGQSEGKRIAH